VAGVRAWDPARFEPPGTSRIAVLRATSYDRGLEEPDRIWLVGEDPGTLTKDFAVLPPFRSMKA